VIRIVCILSCLFVFCSAQIAVTYLGEFGGTGSASGLFKNPAAVKISDDQRLFICDRGNHRIQIFDMRGNYLAEFGRFGWQEREFDEPVDICVNSTLNIYVADYNNQRVQRFDRSLNFISVLNSNPGDLELYQFREVLSVVYSGQGDLFILDGGENKVIKFTAQNQGQAAFGLYESGMGELLKPVQIDISSRRQIVVTDSEGHGIYLYDYFGSFLQKIEQDDLVQPHGLSLDRQDRIYVTDLQTRSVYIFSIRGKFLGKISELGGNSLKNPRDLALFYIDENTYRLYLIDGDNIIIAEINYRLPGK
jgi:sugar lactone lactonase YvrE